MDETVIAEFDVVSPTVVLGPTLAGDLAVAVHAERLPVSHEATTWFHVTVECADFEAFEAAVADDPTVASAEVFTEYDATRRTYRLTIADDVPVMTANAAALGEELVDLRSRGDGWRVHLRTSDRDSLRAFVEFCADHDIDCSLQRVYEARDPVGTIAVPVDADDADLLRTALDAGYFEVPRETTLAALATEFDCSESTLSVRLRRSTRDLLAEALGEDDTGSS